MLPRAHRMRRSPDFAAAVRRGRRSGRSRLVVYLLPTGSGTPPLVGFVVSRSVGGSVVRNRVERRLRHLVASRLDRLPTGSSLVVRAAPSASAATSAQLGEDLDSALASALRPGPAARGPRRPRVAAESAP